MQLLGNLGINVNLLIAQMINFALLLWLLSYFIYKPTIRIIEKNEADLDEGRKQKKIVEEEKSAFIREKEKEQAEMKARNKRAVEDIAAAAELVRNRSREKAGQESVALIEQTRSVLTLEKPMIVQDLTGELKSAFSRKFKESFDTSVPSRYQAEMESVLFKAFLDEIKAAPLEMPAEDELKELRKLARTNGTEYRKKIEQKFGIISLEYATALAARERNEVKKVIAEKVGLKVLVTVRQNKRLVSGFRLEIAGRVIESSISNVIHHAENI